MIYNLEHSERPVAPSVLRRWKFFFGTLGVSFQMHRKPSELFTADFRLDERVYVFMKPMGSRTRWIYVAGPDGLNKVERDAIRRFVDETREGVLVAYGRPSSTGKLTCVYYDVGRKVPVERDVRWVETGLGEVALAGRETPPGVDMMKTIVATWPEISPDSRRMKRAYRAAGLLEWPSPSSRKSDTVRATGRRSVFGRVGVLAIYASLIVVLGASGYGFLNPAFLDSWPPWSEPGSGEGSGGEGSGGEGSGGEGSGGEGSGGEGSGGEGGGGEGSGGEGSSGDAGADARDDPEVITVMSWNMESGGSDPAFSAKQIEEYGGVDLWGFSEVNPSGDEEMFETAAEHGEKSSFASVQSVSGGGDRLLAIYDSERFSLIRSMELEWINTTGDARAPLVLDLVDKNTDTEFLFMVNHLYRSKEDQRHLQADLLKEWVQEQALPVIAVGDYNFDWDVESGCSNHDAGYDKLVDDGYFYWVRPEGLITTQCSGWPCTFDSVLDFLFVSGSAQTWEVMSEIVVSPGDFPDSKETSDHRPVAGYVRPTTEMGRPAAKQDLVFRTGTGDFFPSNGSVRMGHVLDVVARTDDSSWLQTYCGEWVRASSVDLPWPIDALPVVGEPGGIVLVVEVNDGSEEILGLQNRGRAAVGIGGWRLHGSSGEDECFVPDGTTVGAGETFYVASGESEAPMPGYKCSGRTIWVNKGETVYVETGAGELVVEEWVKRVR